MNIEQARFNMIEQQIRPWEVLDPNVLDLLFVVKREDFAPAAYRNLAFADMELPIGQGQVMLAPRVEARLMQELGLKKTDKVLEIGTGSGYMAALLAAHADRVWTVELNPELAETARANLKRQGIENVVVETGNGSAGWPAHAPYDIIVVSASVPAVPAELLAQLKVGGRLFAIVGELPAMTARLVTRTGEAAYGDVGLFETSTAPLVEMAARPRFAF